MSLFTDSSYKELYSVDQTTVVVFALGVHTCCIFYGLGPSKDAAAGFEPSLYECSNEVIMRALKINCPHKYRNFIRLQFPHLWWQSTVGSSFSPLSLLPRSSDQSRQQLYRAAPVTRTHRKQTSSSFWWQRELQNDTEIVWGEKYKRWATGRVQWKICEEGTGCVFEHVSVWEAAGEAFQWPGLEKLSVSTEG